MNTNLEQIENYLTGQLTPNERQSFENALQTDPAVAEALAFYLLTKQVAAGEAVAPALSPAERSAREQRRAELNARHKSGIPAPEVGTTSARPITRPLWGVPMQWVAAASIVLLLSWYFFFPSGSSDTRQLADQYVTEHFTQLPTTMDGGTTGSSTADSIKQGIDLFNTGKLAEADAVFQRLVRQQPNNANALKMAGIVSLRRGNYDQAIDLFHRLGQRTDLFANPGTFYEALAYLKRGRPLDKNKAEKLLNEVINRNLDGRSDAEKLLNRSQ